MSIYYITNDDLVGGFSHSQGTDNASEDWTALTVMFSIF